MARMIRLMFISIPLVLLFGGTATAAMDVKTKRCSPAAQAALDEAFQFIKDHRHELMHDFKVAKRKGKRRRIRRRFDRKLGKMRVSCAERVICRKAAPRNAMHPFGIAGRKIRLCYDKMIADSDTDQFCDLTGTIAHEFGHAIGIKKDRAGGHSRNQNDRVYKFGNFAERLCEQEARAASAWKVEFSKPRTNNGRHVDWCHRWGHDCGAPAADAFCQQKGFTRATGFRKDKDVNKVTVVLASGRTCDGRRQYCDSFRKIECAKRVENYRLRP
jgi:hypothetical protein